MCFFSPPLGGKRPPPPPPPPDDLFSQLNSGTPNTATLSSYGLTTDLYNKLNTAAGGGYEGWSVVGEYDSIRFFWSSRTEAQFNAVVHVVRNEFPRDDGEDGDHVNEQGPKEDTIPPEHGSGTFNNATGSFGGKEWRYSIMRAITEIHAWGEVLPPNTLVVNFWEEEES